jgi:hypothetical protein
MVPLLLQLLRSLDAGAGLLVRVPVPLVEPLLSPALGLLVRVPLPLLVPALIYDFGLLLVRVPMSLLALSLCGLDADKGLVAQLPPSASSLKCWRMYVSALRRADVVAGGVAARITLSPSDEL